MRTVKELLAGKGSEIWSVGPKTSVFDAIAMMAEKGVGALMVLEGDQVLGVVSERDYARKVILQGRASNDTPVEAIMTRRVVYVDLDQTVEGCMALMTDKRIRHLPVMHEGSLVGVLSIGDLVKSIIEEQQFVIAQLESYINS